MIGAFFLIARGIMNHGRENSLPFACLRDRKVHPETET